MQALARVSTPRMPPATAMWLSLISTASSSPKRWLKPPPQRTAYFSSARNPGAVLRVQMTRALVWAMRLTNSAVAVAMPERWPRKLSAVRSDDRMARALPEIVISLVPGLTAAPSRPCGSILISGDNRRNAASTRGRPEITPALRATTIARPGASSGTVAIEVTSPARPRSSSSARLTAASISSGEIKASGRSSAVAIDIGKILRQAKIHNQHRAIRQTHAAKTGPAMQPAGNSVFVWEFSSQPLYCATFAIQAVPGDNDRDQQSTHSRAIDVGGLAHPGH